MNELEYKRSLKTLGMTKKDLASYVGVSISALSVRDNAMPYIATILSLMLENQQLREKIEKLKGQK